MHSRVHSRARAWARSLARACAHIGLPMEWACAFSRSRAYLARATPRPIYPRTGRSPTRAQPPSIGSSRSRPRSVCILACLHTSWHTCLQFLHACPVSPDAHVYARRVCILTSACSVLHMPIHMSIHMSMLTSVQSLYTCTHVGAHMSANYTHTCGLCTCLYSCLHPCLCTCPCACQYARLEK